MKKCDEVSLAIMTLHHHSHNCHENSETSKRCGDRSLLVLTLHHHSHNWHEKEEEW